MWVVYIIETDRGKLYTGITNDLARRFNQHLTGKGAKYFRLDRPRRILFSKECSDRSEASVWESKIKKLNRAHKLKLIQEAS